MANGWGGRRSGAGRKPKPRPLAPEAVQLLEEVRATQREYTERVDRALRIEHGEMILRRLTELERLVRGDQGLAEVSKHTRRRPLGVR